MTKCKNLRVHFFWWITAKR